MARKLLDGTYLSRANNADAVKTLTHQLLVPFGLKSEREGVIIVAQKQCLPTRIYQVNIFKNGSSPNMVYVFNKRHHSSCCLYAAFLCLRSISIGMIRSNNIFKHLDLSHQQNTWEHKPSSVLGNDTIFFR